MTTSAIIEITQFEVGESTNSIREIVAASTADGSVRQVLAGVTSSVLPGLLPAVSQPTSRDGSPVWQTEDPEDWSDSPTRQPLLLYRYRFGWGRDEQELFSVNGMDALGEGAPGLRWRNLDNAAGLLVYMRLYPSSSSAHLREFKVKGSGYVRQRKYNVGGEFERLVEFEGPTGEGDLTQFPFLLTARPEPFSVKNPVDTDVFIRLANYTWPIASGTINLYLDDVLQPALQFDEFVEGLGGFDVTWVNTFDFDYDAQVDVRWSFRDTDSPANRFEFGYPFYIVPDLAGPRVSALVPADEAVDVPIAGPIQFDLEDFENDVDTDSLALYVNNVHIVNGDNGTIELFRFENERGYTVRFTPEEPWLYGDLIPVALFVEDTSVNENKTFFTYSFTTLESTAPRMLNLRPLACTIAVPVGTEISVDVIDGGHGLDKDSIVFTVEEKEQGNLIQLIPIVHRDE